MRAYKVKTIRSLDRGLHVLEVLQSLRAATLNELYRETGLARATLIRVLMTLRQRGLIWQRMADGAFMPSYTLFRRGRDLDDISHLVEVASPILEELCAKVKWPSVLAVRRLFHMEVIETNMQYSYFDYIPLGPVGFRINMLHSATGRAYLAACEPEEREEILAGLRKSPHPGDARAGNPNWVQGVVRRTQLRGFGLRAAGFGGHYDKPRSQHDDGRNSIAVPINVAGHGILGCVNLTWLKKVASVDEITELHLGDLRHAVATISAAMQVD